MFGLLVAGRPVDANAQAVSETQYAFKIVPAPAFNHIVVFLLPGTQLPPGTAATVYVQIPPAQGFRLLGGIGPGKESAIFRISGVRSGTGNGAAAADADGDLMTDDAGGAGAASGVALAGGEIVVGVSIEPAQQVEAQLATLKSSSGDATTGAMVKSTGTASPVTTKVLAQRIIGNAFNFLASFGSDQVPLKAFQAWWEKFEKKVEMDPSFLEREQG